MKPRIMVIALVVLITSALVAGGILNYTEDAKKNIESYIRIDTHGYGAGTVEVHELRLVPGEVKEQTVLLACPVENMYDIVISYEELSESTIKHFTNVEFEFGGEVLCTASLAELLAGKTVTFSTQLLAESNQELLVRYSMPHNTGNAAKGATADFNLCIAITSELAGEGVDYGT
ncbi:MAG: hypothetical protein IJY50_06320 [Clostridia bacterium]|nr:hypothetical protein [Clostridia bacterium]